MKRLDFTQHCLVAFISLERQNALVIDESGRTLGALSLDSSNDPVWIPYPVVRDTVRRDHEVETSRKVKRKMRRKRVGENRRHIRADKRRIDSFVINAITICYLDLRLARHREHRLLSGMRCYGE